MLSMQIPFTITPIYDTLYSHFKKQVQYSDKKYVNCVAKLLRFTVYAFLLIFIYNVTDIHI